jgi:sugar lactone lactonase YvrE
MAMQLRSCALLLALAAAAPAFADDTNPYKVSVHTLITTPLVIEGLTNDSSRNLYAPGRATAAGQPCPVYKVNVDHPTLVTVGQVPAPSATGSCSPSGLAFGPDGQLYVTQTDSIYRFTPSEASPPTATLFASGVPGTNGLAFDWNGNLWTGDGTTAAGRVWMIDRTGNVLEMFRIPPMINEVNQAAGGIGRDVRSAPPATVTVTPTSRNASNTLGSQPLVANGLQFDHRGNLYIADTARGAIWRVKVSSNSTPLISTGCDTTYTANTLCMDHVLVAHPFLEGVDGIVVDVAGNIWADANERQAVIYVYTNTKKVVEVYRNPVNASKLRNDGPLETPTSPVLVDFKFCTANSDGNRRDNFPSTAGEVGGAGQPRGKISCIDQDINVPGIQLPIR